MTVTEGKEIGTEVTHVVKIDTQVVTENMTGNMKGKNTEIATEIENGTETETKIGIDLINIKTVTDVVMHVKTEKNEKDQELHQYNQLNAPILHILIIKLFLQVISKTFQKRI